MSFIRRSGTVTSYSLEYYLEFNNLFCDCSGDFSPLLIGHTSDNLLLPNFHRNSQTGGVRGKSFE